MVECLVNTRVILSCLFLLISLLAAPVIAATVTCPSDCTCLLPAEAKNLGLPGYCNGRQVVCATDGKIDKYCYARTVTVTTITTLPQMIVTGFHTVPTTVPEFVKCSPGCSCKYEPLGKMANYTLCGGTQHLCGMDRNDVPMYCYVIPQHPSTGEEVITMDYNVLPVVTKVPPPLTAPVTPGPTVSCSSGCTCLIPEDAATKGLKYCGGKQASCSVSSGLTPTGAPKEMRYCFSIPALTAPITNVSRVAVVDQTTVSPLAVTKECPKGCSCLDEKTIRDKGYFYCSTERTECGREASGEPLYCAKTEFEPYNVKPSSNFISEIVGFFGALFGMSTAPAQQEQRGSVLVSYCESRYGPNFHMCNGACVDSLTDEENCGGCGNWCNSDPGFSGEIGTAYTCYNGQCLRQDDLAGSSQYTCGIGGSIDCPAGSPCLNGVCSTLGCLDPELTACNNICISTSLDENNCGSCGNTCTLPNQTCRAGLCYSECTEPGTGYCRNIIDGNLYCAELDSDQFHCGRCQHSCDRSQLCSRGECVSECPTDLTYCMGGCVDTLTSEWNCGECGHRCDREPGGRWRENCINGECQDPDLVNLPPVR